MPNTAALARQRARLWYAMALLAVIAIGAFLRLEDFRDRVRFNNDQVRDTRIAMDMLTTHTAPLLGPKAGGTTFQLGPAFYYILAFSGAVFGATPEGIAFIVPLLSIATLPLLFLFLRRCFASHIALPLTLLAATSFFLIKYSRFVWNPNVIPFFLLAFLLTLLHTMDLPAKKRTSLWWWILLGVVAGIGMQLHTTLLIIMPLTILIMHITRRFLHDRPLPIGRLLLTFTLIAALLSPMFLFDLRNGGANSAAFFAGSAKKTSLGSTVDNVIHVAQFFGQGSVYVLTGTEPTRDWTAPRKLITHPFQLLLAGCGILLCTVGTIATLIAVRRSNNTRRTHALTATLCIVVLHILILLPIGDTLQTRFFLTLFFVPFVWIGLLTEHLILRVRGNASARIIYGALAIACLTLIAGNLSAYRTTYAFDPTTKNADLYGGISLGELHGIVAIMAQSGIADTPIYLLPHAYGRSIRFIADTRGDVRVETADADTIPSGATAFFLSNKSNARLSDTLTAAFVERHHDTVQRWHVFTLEKR